MPDCKEKKEPEKMEQTFLPNKWKKNCNNAWQWNVGPDQSSSDSSSVGKYSE